MGGKLYADAIARVPGIHALFAASGDLGYLTGPVRNVRKSRDNGAPRHSTYASLWKRQRDGSFKVILDFGVNTPGPVTFANGFTRAPVANRFTGGDYDENTPPLSAADSVLNSGLRVSQVDAYRGRLASSVRFLRQNMMPVVGNRAALQWLARQPAYTGIDSHPGLTHYGLYDTVVAKEASGHEGVPS